MQVALLMLVLALTLSRSQAMSLRLEVDRGDMFCLFENFTDTKPEKYTATFYILDGGDTHNVLDFYVKTPNATNDFDTDQKDYAKVIFMPEEGEYKFCMDNSGDWKLVEFSLYPVLRRKDERRLEKIISGDDSEPEPTMMEDLIDGIDDDLDYIDEFQLHLKQRSSRGLYNTVNLHHAVNKWSLMQAVLVIVTTLGQVFIVRRLFRETKGPRKQEITT